MNNSILVCCRVKPTVNNELSGIVYDNSKQNISMQGLSFTFDKIFGPECKQEEIFDSFVRPIVLESIKGYNATLFSYGQTGSGKTHTIQGSNSDIGVIGRTAELLFHNLISDATTTKTDISISCLEIYQEKIFDLLSPKDTTTKIPTPFSSSNRNLKIRDSLNGGVWVEGLQESIIANLYDFNELLNQAIKKRVTAAHGMNDRSSRSHFCLTISLTQIKLSTREKISSKIHIIDLAGSEMVKKTEVSGGRLQEAKHINKSLSALGNVISALSQLAKTGMVAGTSSLPDNRSTQGSHPVPHRSTLLAMHIPYRDSKLTRLLQDSLSGNSKTALILTVSGSNQQSQETLSTLRFGERAKQIKTIPVQNVELEDKALRLALKLAEQRIVALTLTIKELQKQQDILAPCKMCSNMISSSLITDIITSDTNVNRSVSTAGATTKQKMNTISSKNTNDDLMTLKIASVYSEELNTTATSNTTITTTNEKLKDDCEETRCAVCGLNDEESLRLRQETSEDLGPMFTCDGNCGFLFHSRCAGSLEPGEGEAEREGGASSIAVPEGEWFCTVCAATPTFPDSDSDLRASSRTTEKEQDTDTVAARLLADYHTMRRERNRVLRQWQHEKKLHEAISDIRKEADRRRDEELIHSRMEVEALRAELQKHIELMKTGTMSSPQNGTLVEPGVSPVTYNSTSSSFSSTSHSADSELLPSPTSSLSPYRYNLLSKSFPNSESINKSNIRPKRHQNHHDNNKLINSSNYAENNLETANYSLPSMSTLESNNTVKGSHMNDYSGSPKSAIPKPWIYNKRKKESAFDRAALTDKLSPRNLTSSDEQIDSYNSGPSSSLSYLQHSPIRLRELPSKTDSTAQGSNKKQLTGPTTTSTTATPHLNKSNFCSQKESQHALNSITSSNDGDNNFSSYSAQDNSFFSSSVYMNENNDDDVNGEIMTVGNNRFLKPLKSRLRVLLKSVQEETGSYVEIRKRFKDRELERSQLKSRQLLRRDDTNILSTL